MDRYKFFDKTADAKFQAYGYTMEEAFRNAEEAMISIMFNPQEIIDYDIHREKRDIEVKGINLESLLYNFLEEVIFLLAAESFIGLVEKILIKKNDDEYTLNARLDGTQSINFESHNEVKAVTYNEMYVKTNDNGMYEVQVVVDI